MLPEKCQQCNKPKKIYLTQILEGKIKQVDVCVSCPLVNQLEQTGHYGALDNLSGGSEIVFESSKDKDSSLQCPCCQLTFEQYKKSGRLGCGTCYTTFRKLLRPLLKSIHRGLHHTGKTPAKGRRQANLKVKIRAIKKQIEDSLSAEDYERAAALRDQIRNIESDLSKTTSSASTSHSADA